MKKKSLVYKRYKFELEFNDATKCLMNFWTVMNRNCPPVIFWAASCSTVIDNKSKLNKTVNIRSVTDVAFTVKVAVARLQAQLIIRRLLAVNATLISSPSTVQLEWRNTTVWRRLVSPQEGGAIRIQLFSVYLLFFVSTPTLKRSNLPAAYFVPIDTLECLNHMLSCKFVLRVGDGICYRYAIVM